MDSSAPKKWVVLIQRAPQGPFTQAQIDDLLDKKVIHGNEPAYLVSDDDKTPAWKFLWQFQEFERRKTEPGKNATYPSGKRQAPPSGAELKAKIRKAVPDELQKRPKAEPKIVVTPMPASSSGSSMRTWASLAIAVAVFGFLSSKFFSASTREPATQEKVVEKSAPVPRLDLGAIKRPGTSNSRTQPEARRMEPIANPSAQQAQESTPSPSPQSSFPPGDPRWSMKKNTDTSNSSSERNDRDDNDREPTSSEDYQPEQPDYEDADPGSPGAPRIGPFGIPLGVSRPPQQEE